MFRTPDAWWSAMAKRPQTEQEALQTDLRNAYISIHFDNDLGMRDRAALLHHLQGFLLEHPHFNGDSGRGTRHPAGIPRRQDRSVPVHKWTAYLGSVRSLLAAAAGRLRSPRSYATRPTSRLPHWNCLPTRRMTNPMEPWAPWRQYKPPLHSTYRDRCFGVSIYSTWVFSST